MAGDQDGTMEERGGSSFAHILLVEDDEALRELVATALRDDGHRVTTASQGALALEKAGGFDLLIIDLETRNPEAIGIIGRLRDRPRPTFPVLFIGGGGTQDLAAASAEAGADDFVKKPFSLFNLQERVWRLLQASGAADRSDRQVARLEEIERLGERVTQMVVRDQTSLLNGLFGYLNLLDIGDLSADQRRAVRAASCLVREVRDLGQDLIDFDRLAARRLPLTLRPLDLRRLVLDAAAEARTVAGSARRLAVEIPDGLPRLSGDEAILGRALRNVLMNALQYGREQSVEVTVLRSQPDQVSIVVEDDGPAVPPHFHDRVFEAEALGDVRAKLQRKFRGMALPFARMAVRAHGGDLRMDGRPGEMAGVRFVLGLPTDPSRVRVLLGAASAASRREEKGPA